MNPLLGAILFVVSVVSPVAAFDAGDGIMLTIGIILLIVGILALLGYIARQRSPY